MLKTRLQIGDTDHDGFTVKNIHGCRVVYGAIPVSEIGMLFHGFSKNAQIAIDIADRIGAALVIGEPEDLDGLRRMDLPMSAKRQADCRASNDAGLQKVAEWLGSGERGVSSNAMCKHIFGLPQDAGNAHPLDPDDLRRCVLFLDATDAHDKVPAMHEVSPGWARLVNRWDDLLAAFAEEGGVSGKSWPKTYALMREARGV